MPALAESVGWGYGSVGSNGFNRPPVETRWHRGFRHSDFLTEDFCKRFWVPFLNGDKPVYGDKATREPKWISAITWLPLRWPVIVVLLTFLGFLIWAGACIGMTIYTRAYARLIPNIDGIYSCLGRCQESNSSPQVRQDGASLLFKNEVGQISSGVFLGATDVRANDWGTIGHISSDARTIAWSNNSRWVKK